MQSAPISGEYAYRGIEVILVNIGTHWVYLEFVLAAKIVPLWRLFFSFANLRAAIQMKLKIVYKYFVHRNIWVVPIYLPIFSHNLHKRTAWKIL
jgi:hypothetical protein